jgi:hypothetical protein
VQCTQGVTRGTSDLMAADHRVRGLHGDPAGSAGFALQLVFDDFGFQLGQFADPSETKPGRFEQVTSFLADCIKLPSTTNPVQENAPGQAVLK